jgi:hypothetical protein
MKISADAEGENIGVLQEGVQNVIRTCLATYNRTTGS